MLILIAIGISLFTLQYVILEVPLQNQRTDQFNSGIESQDVPKLFDPDPYSYFRPIVDLLVNQALYLGKGKNETLN